MRIGIVGHDKTKFTPETEQRAKLLIRTIIDDWYDGKMPIIISGHCPNGGVDIWAEEIADEFGYDKRIYPPKHRSWSKGYKPRNLLIARNSDVVHVIVVKELPIGYHGMKFESCYHCNTTTHVKSGGCWTGLKAREFGKIAIWHIIDP